MADGLISAAADSALEDFLIALSALPNGRREALFRSYLEDKIDALEQLEIEYHAFLADAVGIAAQRMQDIRLEVIELRLNELENPAFNMRDMVFDLAVLVTMELAVILAPHLLVGAAGGAFGMLVSNRQRSRTVRRFGGDGLPLKLQGELVDGYTERLGRELVQKYNRIEELEAEFRAASQVYRNANARKLKADRFGELSQMTQAEQDLKRATERVREATAAKNKAIDDAKAVRIDHAVARERLRLLEKEIADTKLPGKMAKQAEIGDGKLDDFWKAVVGDTTETIRGRLAEEAGPGLQSLAKYQANPPPTDSVISYRFSPTEVMASYLAMIRRDQRDASLQFARMRNLVRYTADDSLFVSRNIQAMTRCLLDAVATAETDMAVLPTMAPMVAYGIEFMMWGYWLNNTGKLTTQAIAKAVPHSMSDGRYGPGDRAFFFENVLLTQVWNETQTLPALTPGTAPITAYVARIKGTAYPMAGGFPEALTDHLYKTFTAPYLDFVDVPLPCRYDAAEKAALKKAYKLEKFIRFGLVENPERIRLFRLMAVLNTHAFQHFFAQLDGVTPAPFFADKGKSAEDIFQPLSEEPAGTGLTAEEEERLARSKSTRIVEMSGIGDELTVKLLMQTVDRLMLDVRNKRAAAEFWMANSAEFDLYVQFATLEHANAQRDLARELDHIDTVLSAAPDLAELVDEAHLAEARKLTTEELAPQKPLIPSIFGD